ncbi:amidohydrolase family protein [Altererythrobacter arenosus]|uniref:Amidohydrolase family protein n=1 Tax=Altererythrobacter arenosus TaxID=3032592 RepID=A0ABY8FSH3_9SPHN|nr:amidohydrolase family protein [Altererythrobacter sp. CAU 1644]WFL77792.1 amidohydrolase family protein [Altererythrobacter sp. CAU 1644]
MKKAATVTGKALGLMIVILVALFFVAVAWPQRSAPLPDASQNRLISNIHIIDVERGETSQLTNLRIRDGVIAAIDPNLAPVEGERVTEGAGGYLVPGFWDMHVHTFQSSPQMHLPLWVANGVTSVRDLMDCPEEEDSLIACVEDKRRWNNESAEGRLAAPHLVETGSYYLENPDMTPAEAVARVRLYKKRGLDAIKVYNRLRPDSYFAAADEAQSRGLRLVGHLPKAVSLPEAIEAGQISFEHARVLPRHCFDRVEAWRKGELDDLSDTALTELFVTGYDPARCDEAIAALASAEAWIVPTHTTREEDARATDPDFIDDPRLAYLDPLSRWAYNDDLSGTRDRYPGERGKRALNADFDHGLHLTSQAHDGGVGILVGTDTVIGGFRYHDEMAHLIRAGLTTAEVLRAATIDAARYVGLEDATGSVTVGKRADLVLLSDNPLQNIDNTRTIRAVFQNGRLYDRERLDDMLAFVRGQARAPHNWAKLLWGFARTSVRSDL